MTTQALLNDCAESIINTRDMVGDEMAALIEWEKENRRLTPEEHKIVADKIKYIWEQSKLGANK